MSGERSKEQVRPAVLCLGGWHGCTEHDVLVVGETSKRYRIEAIRKLPMAGRNRVLAPGERALVPKYAVRFTGVV